MHATKLSVTAVALLLLALGLGPGAPRAHAQDRGVPALRYAEPSPLETTRAETDRAQRRLSLGFGIAGIVTGAVGMLIGGPVLLIAGTTRTHCEGSWLIGPRTCVDLPDDAGTVAGGVVSIGLGFAAVITGIVLIAARPRATAPRLSLGGDSRSVSVSIDGTF